MAKTIKTTYGKLVSAFDAETGQPYDNWIKDYIDRPGLIVIGESEKTYKGKKFAYFYPEGGMDNPWQSYFHTPNIHLYPVLINERFYISLSFDHKIDDYKELIHLFMLRDEKERISDNKT